MRTNRIKTSKSLHTVIEPIKLEKERFRVQINNSQFDDKTIMQDALASQKFLTSGFNTFANECVTPQVRNEFMSILTEEHQIQSEVFDEMQKRGWYQTQPADQAKISQTKSKFSGMNV